MHHFQAVIVMLSCLGDLPAAAVDSPVLFLLDLAPTLLLVYKPWLVNESKIESIFQSIFQSMVQSRVQVLHRPFPSTKVRPEVASTV